MISFLGVGLCNYFLLFSPIKNHDFLLLALIKGTLSIIGMFFIGSKLSFMLFDNKTSFKNAMCKPIFIDVSRDDLILRTTHLNHH